MKHLDLFSGIGGFALAAEEVWSDIEHTFCEIDPFCKAVLHKHWPNAYIYDDIRTLTADAERERQLQSKGSEQEVGRRAFDILTGGFPCQPFSQAGQRRGTEDDRHLWPEMLRVIRAFRPAWVVAENVRGLLTQGGGVVFEQVCADLEGEGYDVQPLIIPAVAVDAPHRRDRVWFIAHARHGDEQGQPLAGERRAEAEGGDDRESEQPVADAGAGTDPHAGRPRRQQKPRGASGDEGAHEGGSAQDGDQPASGDKDVAHAEGERRIHGNAKHKRKAKREVDIPVNADSDAPDPKSGGRGEGNKITGRSREGKRTEEERRGPADCGGAWDQNWIEAATRLCVVDDGVPGRLVRPRGWRNAALKAAGNAIVPQVAIEIMEAIKQSSCNSKKQ